MLTLQQQVSTILDTSAKVAANEIIQLFDSSFEAFTEELRERQQEIDALRQKLELVEAELIKHLNPGQAFFCGQCRVIFSTVTLLEEHHKAHHTYDGVEHVETVLKEQQKEHDAPEASKEEVEQCFEFEVLAEDNPCYSQQVVGREGAVVDQEQPADSTERALGVEHQKRDSAISATESSVGVEHQKRGRGRPRKKHKVTIVCEKKRARGRPRKTEQTTDCVQVSKPLENSIKKRQQTIEKLKKVQVELLRKDIPTSFHKRTEKESFQDPAIAKPVMLKATNPNYKQESLKAGLKEQVSTTTTLANNPSGNTVHGMSKIKPQKRGRGRPRKTPALPKEFLCDVTQRDPRLDSEHEVKDKHDKQTNSSTFTDNPSTGSEPLFIPFGEVKSKLNVQENLMLMSKRVPSSSQEKCVNNTWLQNTKGWLVCSKCPRVFKGKKKLQAHQKLHLKKNETSCRICGMTFIGRIQMENHEKVHTREKPFACSFCPKRFPILSQLKKHLLNHATRDYSCSRCAVSSSQVRSGNLQRAHLRGRFPCTNCGNAST